MTRAAGDTMTMNEITIPMMVCKFTRMVKANVPTSFPSSKGRYKDNRGGYYDDADRYDDRPDSRFDDAPKSWYDDRPDSRYDDRDYDRGERLWPNVQPCLWLRLRFSAFQTADTTTTNADRVTTTRL